MLPRVPRNLEPLALLCLDSPSLPGAVLVSVKASGILAAWQDGVLKSLDQRKARAALDDMNAGALPSGDSGAEAAQALKEWRAASGMTQARAAQVLGMPKRTYEGIEAGKGFAYPQLLMLALLACSGTPEK